MEINFSLSEILVTTLTLLSMGLGYIIKEQREKIKFVQSQLSEKKYKVYHTIYSLYFDIIKNQIKKIMLQI